MTEWPGNLEGEGKRKRAHTIPECRNKFRPDHCQSKFNQISHASALSATIHHRFVGERERERVRCVGGREGERGSERGKERASERKGE